MSKGIVRLQVPRVNQVRLEVDLVGESAFLFQAVFNDLNSNQPGIWTPSMLAASIINEVLLDDAIAHQVRILQH